MGPSRNADGTINGPVRVEGPDGTIGDGFGIIRPGDPEWDAWDEYMRELESAG